MFSLRDPDSVASPALVFFPEAIHRNLRRAVEIAGSPDRLRPHVKTHKTREIVRLELDLGITKHKCATLGEAAMLAECGAPDVLIAYPLVGPNIARLLDLVEKFPATRFLAIGDHADSLRALANAAAARRLTIDVLLDIDVGQHPREPGAPVGDAGPAESVANFRTIFLWVYGIHWITA